MKKGMTCQMFGQDSLAKYYKEGHRYLYRCYSPNSGWEMTHPRFDNVVTHIFERGGVKRVHVYRLFPDGKKEFQRFFDKRHFE
tara:strand:+ start:429 stop:677 length:249 start_codon:yes stop_codon:yes gene_type:complete